MNGNKDRNMSLKVGSKAYIYIYIHIYIRDQKLKTKDVLSDDFDTPPDTLTII